MTAVLPATPDLTGVGPDPRTIAVQRLGVPDPTDAFVDMLGRIRVTVAAWKGGVGKTEFAKELAWLLGGTLVDLDWDRGGASRSWGYRHETRLKAPLIEAMETGRTPRRLKGGPFKADLLPSHPEWVEQQPDQDRIAANLMQWSQDWASPMVIDTHPGGGAATQGAVAVADVVVVPVVLETRPLEALEGMAAELAGYPLYLVPNMISSAPRPMVEWLQRIGQTYNLPTGQMIGSYSWLRLRRLRAAVAAGSPVPAKHQRFVSEITAVARGVVSYAVKIEDQQG